MSYDAAQPYRSIHLGARCRCRGFRRQLNDEEHRRQLRPDLHELAIETGRAYLAEQTARHEQSANNLPQQRTASTAVHFVGGDVVSVLVQQDDTVFGVLVTNE